MSQYIGLDVSMKETAVSIRHVNGGRILILPQTWCRAGLYSVRESHTTSALKLIGVSRVFFSSLPPSWPAHDR